MVDGPDASKATLDRGDASDAKRNGLGADEATPDGADGGEAHQLLIAPLRLLLDSRDAPACWRLLRALRCERAVPPLLAAAQRLPPWLTVLSWARRAPGGSYPEELPAGERAAS